MSLTVERGRKYRLLSCIDHSPDIARGPFFQSLPFGEPQKYWPSDGIHPNFDPGKRHRKRAERL